MPPNPNSVTLAPKPKLVTPHRQGGSMYESIYADGFGGALRVEENAVLVGDRGGVQLCTWWGHGTVHASSATRNRGRVARAAD
eukprot:4767142-Prymnesium_polylepis.1